MYEVCIYTKDITYNPNYDGYAISLQPQKQKSEMPYNGPGCGGKITMSWSSFLAEVSYPFLRKL